MTPDGKKRQVGLENAVKWTTPCADDTGARKKKYQQGGTPLSMQATWQTPTTQDGNGRDRHNQRDGSVTLSLLGQAKTWATPNAPEGAHGGPNRRIGSKGAPGLSMQVIASHRDRKESTDGMVLNPPFVEALMGFPDGWTVCDALATPSSPSKRRGRGKVLSNALESEATTKGETTMKNDTNELQDMIVGLIGELDPIAGSLKGLASGLAQESAKNLLGANADALDAVLDGLRIELKQAIQPGPVRKPRTPKQAAPVAPRQIAVPGTEPAKAKRGRPRKDATASTGNNAQVSEGSA
jgi:hypothetical protein